MYNDPFLQVAHGANSTTMPTIGHLINGKLVAGGSRSQDVFNPATGKAEKRLLLADAATLEQAIASSQAAYPAWRATPPLKRARVMGKLKQLLEEHADQLCALLTAEHGKVVGDALGESFPASAAGGACRGPCAALNASVRNHGSVICFVRVMASSAWTVVA